MALLDRLRGIVSPSLQTSSSPKPPFDHSVSHNIHPEISGERGVASFDTPLAPTKDLMEDEEGVDIYRGL